MYILSVFNLEELLASVHFVSKNFHIRSKSGMNNCSYTNFAFFLFFYSNVLLFLMS